MWPSACRKLATIPSAESVRVPSRSKMTNCGAFVSLGRIVSLTLPLWAILRQTNRVEHGASTGLGIALA